MSKETIAFEITKLYLQNHREDDILVFAQKFMQYYEKVLSSLM